MVEIKASEVRIKCKVGDELYIDDGKTGGLITHIGPFEVKFGDRNWGFDGPDNAYPRIFWKQISNNNENMSLMQKFQTAFLSEPEKTFRKHGITEQGGLLTQEGQALFLQFLLSKHGAEFKKEVVDLLVADCKENKCAN